LLVGSPQQVIDKILYEHELFKFTRFMVQFSVGTLPHKQMMHAIELFGNVVAPAVKKALTGGPTSPKKRRSIKAGMRNKE
jgi:hypothetical protein